jgi:glutaredoxin
MPELALYARPGCPYCRKVLDFARREKISLAIKNAGEADVSRELIRIGGKPQVPCLVSGGKARYESDEIIRWLKENYPR